jgi:hypothetical protein
MGYDIVADTYFTPAECDGPVSNGNSVVLRAKDNSPHEMILVRFRLDMTAVALLKGGGSAVLSFPNAMCTGQCTGSVHPMRSDWDEGTGLSDGADYCRIRGTNTPSWGDGGAPLNSISTLDYDSNGSTISQTGSAWSVKIPGALLTGRITNANPPLISFFVDMVTAGEIVTVSRESDAGTSKPTLVVFACQ